MITVEAIKRISILDVCKRLGITGVEALNNLYRCSCPFHSDSDPSFTIYPFTNSYYCFGCDRGGDTLKLVQEVLNCSFPEAINWFDSNYGMVEKLPTFAVQNKKQTVQQEFIPIESLQYWNSLLWALGKQKYFEGRGFESEFFDTELWGWNGTRYVVPVWDGLPQVSNCIGARLRKEDGVPGPKYIGYKNFNKATVWGRAYASEKIIFGFAGEFDAARAVQDNLPSFSLVNGMLAFNRFDPRWPEIWFPESEKLILIFDRKELVSASRVAKAWEQVKGFGTSFVFNWPPNWDVDDYCEFRQKFNFDLMLKTIEKQTGEQIYVNTRIRKITAVSHF